MCSSDLETEREVPVTVPMPAIDKVLALLTDQLKVAVCPDWIVDGEAVNEVMVGAELLVLLTVTVTLAVVDP